MKNGKRMAAMLGVGALAITSLAACSSSDNPNGKPTSTEPAATDKSLSIMVLGASQDTNTYLEKELLPGFEAKTGIPVTLQSSDWGSAFQKITTAAASNQMADVVVLGAIWTAPLAEKGALAPLDEYVSKWDDAKHFYPAMMDDGKWKDVQYSIPFGVDLRAPLYRKDILEDAGVDTSKLPTTWEELRAVAQKVKDAGSTDSPIWWGIDNSIGLQQNYAQLMLQNGAEYWKADGSPNFDSKESKEALEFLTSTFEDGLSNYNLVYSGNGPRPLVAGQAAIALGGMTEYSNADQNKPEVRDQILVGPPLRGPSASTGSVAAWINKFAVAKGSKHPDDAFELIKYICSQDNLSKFNELYGGLPPRDDMGELPWMGEPGNALMEIAMNAKSQPPHPGMMQFGKEINQLLEPAVRGETDVNQTVTQINSKLAAFNK